MENNSKELLMKLVEEQGLIIMGHDNSKTKLFRPIYISKTKQLPQMYTSENIDQLRFPSNPVFLVKKKTTIKKLFGIPRKITSYVICAMFIESHRIQAYVYGEEYRDVITNIAANFSHACRKYCSVNVELNENPGTEYFFPKGKIGNDEYLGSGYLRIKDPTEEPRWMKYFFLISLCCTVLGVFVFSSIVFQIGFVSLMISVVMLLFHIVLTSGSRITMYRTTADHFKSAVVRKQLIDLEPLCEKIDKEGYVRGYD